MAASGVASTIFQSHDTLAGSTLPVRVRRILDVLLTQLQPELATRLDATADALEQELFTQAERARSNELQGTHMANLQLLRKHRARLLPQMAAALESELANLRTPREAPEEPAEIPSMLTLVADDDIDQDIVLQEIARRHENRHHEALTLLSQRMGVLAGSPALEEAQQPLSPQSLCRALRAAAAELDVDLPTQLQFYRLFEQHGMASYGDLLDALSELLGQQGVLPGLVFAPQRARTPSGRVPVTRDTQSPEVPAVKTPTKVAAPPPMPGAGEVPSWAKPPASTRPAPSASTFASLQRLLSAGHARASATPQVRTDAMPGWLAGAGAGTPSPGGSPGATPSSGMPATPGARTAASPATARSPGAQPGVALPTGKLLSTLQTLQLQVAQGQAPQAPTSLGEIRERTLAGLRRAHGPDAELAREDADTFELLDLLYHEIGREVRKGPAADLLGQLQVPIVQAALNDREFFLRPQHPARELLNAVAESGANWLGEDEVDPVLLQKLKAAVTKVLAEYTGDESVFEHAHREVQDHFQVAARKAEVAERRHVEAARGRDRLELAKRGAAELIEGALDGRQPAPFVQALLTQAWADVLTLTRLRNGEESSEWQEVAGITAHIAQSIGGPGAKPEPELAPRIERALVHVGYHGDEAAVIAQRLSGADSEPPGSADLAARMQARAKTAAAEAPVKVVLPPRSAAEQASYDILRKQPFGTWFEFVHNQQGDVRRLRLSWFNPTSDHALFVNQRGQKVGDHTLDSVARLMAREQARILTEDRGSLIDRAWQATVGKLREMAGVEE
ncbi:Protein of unknown function [Pseudoxanthomonas sp. GM95]|uniref:DUF1631 domain-containing protein n=1 Tax=Pseudoxanthomonas sp. GM95 TaxID=1881043 RepID=UPI0008D291C0|nr:DUF1631 domain-containing protein [Pseudoxanthomonas sp. GM95]SEL64021.1 Protein of unknown function [Pseudoxanthomonas sp. GM95]